MSTGVPSAKYNVYLLSRKGEDMRLKKCLAALLTVSTIASGLYVSPVNVNAAKKSNGNYHGSLQGESIYQIMVDRFYDGDPSNNAKGEAFRNTEWEEEDFRYMHGGDWQGIIDKLDYIKGMGYTAIWISPVSDPQLWGMPDGTGKQWPTAYHGYNAYDPNRASRYFGCEDPAASEAKLKELADKCHEKGIKIILDVVPNHLGDFIQIDDPDNNPHNPHYYNGNAKLKDGTEIKPAAPFDQMSWYHNKGNITNYEDPNNAEDHDMGGIDDLELDNPEAKKAIFKAIKHFVDLTNADAVRVDAAKCMKVSDIHELQEYLGVTSFGENFDMRPGFVSQWVGDKGEDGMLDFPLFQAVVNDFGNCGNFNDTSNGALSVQNVFNQDGYYGKNVNNMVTFIDNHDRDRFLTAIEGNVDQGTRVKRMQNALTFIYSCRGIPTVFQGTEQELGNKWGLSAHGGISDTCNRWNMVEKDFNGKVVADHFNTNTSTYKLIANLNNIRKDHPALQYGTQREMWTSEHLYAFSRRIDDADSEVVTNPDDIEAICAFNNSGEEQSANMSIRKESSIKPGTILVNVFDKNDKVKVSSDGKINVRVPEYSNKIYVVGSYDPVETVSVSFKIKNAETYWGQDVYLVGNCPELGNWDANGATVKAICPDYPTWEVTVELPKNSTIEFKAIKKDGNGNVQWEGGDNKVINVGEQDMNYEFDF